MCGGTEFSGRMGISFVVRVMELEIVYMVRDRDGRKSQYVLLFEVGCKFINS